MGSIATFLILIYTYLLFKKRRRLVQTKKKEAEEEAERIRLEQENSAESGGHGLKRLNTSWQRSLTRSHLKESKDEKVRVTSKSSMVKKSDSSDHTSRELSNVVQEHKRESEKDLKRKSTEQTAIRLDSLNVVKLAQQKA